MADLVRDDVQPYTYDGQPIVQTRFGRRLLSVGFTTIQINTIFRIKDNFCEHCLDKDLSEGPCYCTADE